MAFAIPNRNPLFQINEYNFQLKLKVILKTNHLLCRKYFICLLFFLLLKVLFKYKDEDEATGFALKKCCFVTIF